MKKILKYRNELYGICALWIIIFHVEQKIMGLSIPVLAPLIRNGNFGVDVFMLLSGYCVTKSFERSPQNVGKYYKNRLRRLMIPYLCLATPFWFWKHFMKPSAHGLIDKFFRFGFDLSTISLWVDGTLTTWFVSAILAFYLLLPLMYKIVKRSPITAGALVGGVYALNAVMFLTVRSFYSNFSIALMRLPVFILGIALAVYENRINFSKSLRYVLVAIFLIGCFVFPVRDRLYLDPQWPGLIHWFAYLFLTPGFCILSAEILDRIHAKPIHSVLTWVGGLSLEIYMVHVEFMNVLNYYHLNDKLGWAGYLIVPLFTGVVVGVFSWMMKMARKKSAGNANAGA